MTKIACPACAAHYKVPNEKLGKHVKCAKCGEPFQLTAPADDDGLFPELESLQTGVALATAPAVPLTVAVPPPQRTKPARPGTPGMLAEYVRDVFFGFYRIVAQPWELLTLVVLCGICLLQIVAGYAGLLGLGMKVVITGWYLSFLLKTVQSGAAREDGLPDFSLTDGPMEDIILPCLNFLAVRLIAAAPLIGSLIFATNDYRIEFELALAIAFLGVAMPELALVAALVLAPVSPELTTVVIPPLLIGLAAVPMLVLVVASAGIASLVRVDLMLATIFRTLPGYLVATLIYFGSLGAAVGVGYFAEAAISAGDASAADARNPGPGASSLPAAASAPNAVGGAPVTPPAVRSPDATAVRFAGSLAGRAVAIVIGVLASVFSMRAIGLYYAHFKSRFAWSWE